MSTPTSSSGEEEKNSRTEYNALLTRSSTKSHGMSTSDSNFTTTPVGGVGFWDGKKSNEPTTESLDFEEVESMIWRKVKKSRDWHYMTSE